MTTATYHKDRRARLILDGKCPECGGQPEADRSLCAGCAAAQRVRNERHRRKLGQRVALGCGCGVPGHYSVTCPTGGIPPAPISGVTIRADVAPLSLTGRTR